MISLTIDNRKISVKEGTTILKAAREAGIEIPSLCYMENYPHFTSCMVCMVRDNRKDALLPACSVPVKEGMDIDTLSEEVIDARRSSLELLLTEHTGDCDAPCTRTCPLGIEIPEILAAREDSDRLKEYLSRVPLVHLACTLCPAPCEKSCARGQYDGPVSIRQLILSISQQIHTENALFQSLNNEPNGRHVAVSGASSALMGAAFGLLQKGYSVTMFVNERENILSLEKVCDQENLPPELYKQEEARLIQMGLTVREEYLPEKDLTLFDALVSEGKEKKDSPAERKHFSIESSGKIPRQLAAGLETACQIDARFQGKEYKKKKSWGVKVGRCTKEEMEERIPAESRYGGQESEEGTLLSREKAAKEAKRCIMCSCKKKNDCSLRDYSGQYNANNYRYEKTEKRLFSKQTNFPDLTLEPGKCIKCGICVRFLEKARIKYGFTYLGRSHAVTIGVPFDKQNLEPLGKLAGQAAALCPTGALFSC